MAILTISPDALSTNIEKFEEEENVQNEFHNIAESDDESVGLLKI